MRCKICREVHTPRLQLRCQYCKYTMPKLWFKEPRKTPISDIPCWGCGRKELKEIVKRCPQIPMTDDTDGP